MRKAYIAFLIILAILCNPNTQVIANATSADLSAPAATDSSAVYIQSQSVGILVATAYTTGSIYTPNGTQVEVVHRLEDYSEDDIDDLLSYYSKTSPYKDAELLANPTKAYNCHSYAWYSQNVSTNTFWMDDPSQYYTDGSYCEVETPRAGDIICYFDDMGTSTTSDDINLHSGIVTSVNSSQVNNICGKASLVNVTSKWGP